MRMYQRVSGSARSTRARKPHGIERILDVNNVMFHGRVVRMIWNSILVYPTLNIHWTHRKTNQPKNKMRPKTKQWRKQATKFPNPDAALQRVCNFELEEYQVSLLLKNWQQRSIQYYPENTFNSKNWTGQWNLRNQSTWTVKCTVHWKQDNFLGQIELNSEVKFAICIRGSKGET
jgi:hypothetical protein